MTLSAQQYLAGARSEAAEYRARFRAEPPIVAFLRALANSDCEWMERAACRGAGPDLFFAEPGEVDYHEGRAVCARCPVTSECEAYGRKFGHGQGLWGGLSPEQRNPRRKRA